jgi:hypothetical protein
VGLRTFAQKPRGCDSLTAAALAARNRPLRQAPFPRRSPATEAEVGRSDAASRGAPPRTIPHAGWAGLRLAARGGQRHSASPCNPRAEAVRDLPHEGRTATVRAARPG